MCGNKRELLHTLLMNMKNDLRRRWAHGELLWIMWPTSPDVMLIIGNFIWYIIRRPTFVKTYLFTFFYLVSRFEHLISTIFFMGPINWSSYLVLSSLQSSLNSCRKHCGTNITKIELWILRNYWGLGWNRISSVGIEVMFSFMVKGWSSFYRDLGELPIRCFLKNPFTP